MLLSTATGKRYHICAQDDLQKVITRPLNNRVRTVPRKLPNLPNIIGSCWYQCRYTCEQCECEQSNTNSYSVM